MRSVLAFFLLVVQIASALKFDLPAQSGHGKNERCVRNFVAKDQLVVVTAIVSGNKGDGQVVNMHVCTMLARWQLLMRLSSLQGLGGATIKTGDWIANGSLSRSADQGFHGE
jgi:hypothetical protein